MPEDNLNTELEYLQTKIYNTHVDLPFEVIDRYTRFSLSTS